MELNELMKQSRESEERLNELRAMLADKEGEIVKSLLWTLFTLTVGAILGSWLL